MPIYEYRCEHGHTFEVMQRMSDDPVQACETCAAPVARVFHPVAVHFKGSGFYNTDYGTRKRARENSSETTGKSESASDSTSSTGDAKPSSDTKSSDTKKSSETKTATKSAD